MRANLRTKPGLLSTTPVRMPTMHKKIMEAFAAIVPADADVAAVGDEIAKIIDMPFGRRPFRVHIDPTHDGAEVSFAVIDRMRTEMLRRVGLEELLVPAKIEPEQRTN